MSEPGAVRSIDSVAVGTIEAIGLGALGFPAFVHARGRDYAEAGRVGPLKVEPHAIQAFVHGTRNWRAAWTWKSGDVYPMCDCPAGPLCKHAFALACAILEASQDRIPQMDRRVRRLLARPARGLRESEPRGRAAVPRAAREPAGAGSERAKRPRTRSESLVQELRSAQPWDREMALARILQDSPRDTWIDPFRFRQVLKEKDPDLLCWTLAQEIPRHADGWLPQGLEPYRNRPDLAERAAARSREELADGLARWAKQRGTAPARNLRALFGLRPGAGGRPAVTLEVRLTTPKLEDAPRSASQLDHLRGELRRNPGLLAPPDARLLRVLTEGFLAGARYHHGDTFELEASSINRLLDSLSDSPLATWADDLPPALGELAGVQPRERVRMGKGSVRVVPTCLDDEAGTRIALAVEWPGDRRMPLERVIYLAADDEFHPSLVIADGVFWAVGDEPPAELMQRFARTGSLAVPRDERASYLELLATSFPTIREALEPHTRIHPVRTAMALDLRPDDWLKLRLFAHTGGAEWRPDLAAGETVVFEYAPESRWVRVTGTPAGDAQVDRVDEPSGGATAGAPGDGALPPTDEATPEPAVELTPERADAGQGPEHRAPPVRAAEPVAGTPAPVRPPAEAWLEVPEPAHTADALTWLAGLGVKPGAVRGPGGLTSPATDAHVGWWLRLNPQRLETLAAAWEERPRDTQWFGNRRARDLLGGVRTIKTRMRVEASGVDWLSVSAEWEAEGMKLTEADLEKLRAAPTRFVRLRSGWVRREAAEDHDRMSGLLADLGLEAGGGSQRVTAWQLGQARPETFEALERLGADPATTSAIAALRDRVRTFEGLPRIAQPAGLRAELRPYQLSGLDFLVWVSSLRLGAVLADDMGLGKTVQALAWLEVLRERDPDGGPTLVVCPASVVHNWIREAERFTPGMRVLALTSGSERHELRREIPDHDLVITNYSLLRRDLEQWREVKLRAAILDEAQFVKNPDAAVSHAVRGLDAGHRLALTGTPLENRALDLWSIMAFVNPGYLGGRAAFVNRYDRAEAPPHARRLLAARLRPVMLRRLKQQVALDLPERIEERRDCEMTRGQRQYYLSELMRGREQVRQLSESPGGLGRNKIEILAVLTRLRQVCCHPALAGGRPTLGSGKFEALFELLEPLLAEGHKVLVFSQFVECLKLLRGEMERRAIRNHMLIGSTTKREEVVRAFDQDPDPAVFLISLKAGGTGLNLTAASYVVLFDPWWNPAVEAQAIDRTHRIGQTRTVIAYRMLMQDTIEEKIWELQQRKADLARDVLGEDGFARTLDRADLEYLFAAG